MKTTLYAWLTTAILIWPMTLAAAEIHVSTGFTYESWSSDEDESGSQLSIPIVMDAQQDRFSWHVNAGYASTKGDLADGTEGSVNGFLDSRVGAAYAYENLGGIDWLLGVDLNLPTGKTGLKEDDLRIMIDPDLVSVISPGQGFNVNPYLSAARSWDSWTLGVGVGYAIQGEYDYSEQTENYDPGDIFNTALEIRYAVTDTWTLNLHGQYATFTTDQVDGEDLLQKGDILLIGAGVQGADEKWQLSFSVDTINRGKAKVQNSDGSLVTESRDSQGAEWIAQVQGRYLWRPQTSFTSGLRYLYLSANDYDETNSYYMGRREKVSLSLGAIQSLNSTTNLECTLAGFTMKDDPNWLHPDEDRTYQGWSVSAAVTKSF